MKAGDVVVFEKGAGYRVGLYVERTPGGRHLVRDGTKGDSVERLVERVGVITWSDAKP